MKGWVSLKLLSQENKKKKQLPPPQTPFYFWIIFRADISDHKPVVRPTPSVKGSPAKGLF